MAALKFTNLSRHLKELRIHLCQTSPSSLGVRNFISNNYVALKQTNPDMPILIRECSGVIPKLTARFDKGVEKSISLSEQSAEQVMKSLENLLKSG